MSIATLRAVGGSVMVSIPKPMLEGLGLTANAKVSLHLDGDRLVIEPRRKPKYKLAELLEQCDLETPAHPEISEWDSHQPQGKEII
ncbi:MAG: AbrB/MazE/SpoVT family DNA-binding domain-containing protein [Alphaproteobacteria bacterium]|nr:AbrB/MazE/SpoVT family DNA-binding domain-containing protein [Alphaproteobacteria bacterium]